MDLGAWDELAESTGVPVVIDAAAAIDTLRPVRSISVVSLHATKLMPAGEGGLAVSTDQALINRLRSLSAFGFQGARVSLAAGLNGKLSEYHAAVGLAAMDEWEDTRETLMRLARRYRYGLMEIPGARLQPEFGTSWLSSTCVLAFDRNAALVEAALSARGIASRRWWEYGCHRHLATEMHPRGQLTHTEYLAGTTLGIPFHCDLTEGDVDEICRIVAISLT